MKQGGCCAGAAEHASTGGCGCWVPELVSAECQECQRRLQPHPVWAAGRDGVGADAGEHVGKGTAVGTLASAYSSSVRLQLHPVLVFALAPSCGARRPTACSCVPEHAPQPTMVA